MRRQRKPIDSSSPLVHSFTVSSARKREAPTDSKVDSNVDDWQQPKANTNENSIGPTSLARTPANSIKTRFLLRVIRAWFTSITPFAYCPTTWRSSSTTLSNSSAADLADDAPSANCSFTCVVTLMAVESF